MALRRGSRGEAVVLLQRLLIKQGLLPEGEDDGKFGPKTDEAVRAYQKKFQLAMDGVVGSQTAGSLGLTLELVRATAKPVDLNAPFSPPKGWRPPTNPEAVVAAQPSAAPVSDVVQRPMPGKPDVALAPSVVQAANDNVKLYLDPNSTIEQTEAALVGISKILAHVETKRGKRRDKEGADAGLVTAQNRIAELLPIMRGRKSMGQSLSDSQMQDKIRETKSLFAAYGIPISDSSFVAAASPMQVAQKPTEITAYPRYPTQPASAAEIAPPPPIAVATSSGGVDATLFAAIGQIRQACTGEDYATRRMMIFAGTSNPRDAATNTRDSKGGNAFRPSASWYEQRGAHQPRSIALPEQSGVAPGYRGCQGFVSLGLIVMAGKLSGNPVDLEALKQELKTGGKGPEEQKIAAIGRKLFGSDDPYPVGVSAMRSIASDAISTVRPRNFPKVGDPGNFPKVGDIYNDKNHTSHTGFITNVVPQRDGSVKVEFVDDEFVTQTAILNPGAQFIRTERFIASATSRHPELAAAQQPSTVAQGFSR